MPMNPNFLCCIGAELKNSTQQTTRMSQIYFYRAFEEETVADMLQPGFFNAAMGIVRKDDLLLLYDPKDESARWTYCRVSNVDRSGVEISLIGVNAKDVLVEIPGEDPITLQSLIDDTIMPAIENIGDMVLPVITDGGTAPTNLSEAIRQIVTQNLTLTEDSVEPQSGQFSLWGAIKKALENAKNFFSSISNLDTRLNALEGQGGPVGSYDFGKSFPNILDATDTQLVAGVMVDNIWAGHTPIVWTTPIANSTFTDGDGVDRTVGEIFNGTWIINSYDGTRIVLTNTPNTTPPIFSYQNVGVYSVGFANATTAGVVRVGTGSDMTVDQITGDISIDDTKGYSIFHRLISLFTSAEKTQIRSDLNAASRDMDDLSATGQNIANWSSNVSNCITEIPQDIKLELNNGTLILKAGSKVYVPNGSNTFDIITTTADKTMFDSSVAYNDKILMCYDSNNNILVGARISGTNTIGSGTLANRPAASSMSFGAGLYYATDENKLYIGNKGANTWTTGSSFPIAIVTLTSGVGCTSIDQVFNGFGYIGSTVFVLPGVKALAPNGINSDGTLKSSVCVVESLQVKNNLTDSRGYTLALNTNGAVATFFEREYTQNTYPGTGYKYWYNPSENKAYNTQTAQSSQTEAVSASLLYFNNPTGSLIPKKAFKSLDYSDSDYIANCGMPSSKVIDLTVGVTGTTYTMPDNGHLLMSASSTATNQNIQLSGATNLRIFSSAASQAWRISIPVSKGDNVAVNYNMGSVALRFIYANGAQ